MQATGSVSETAFFGVRLILRADNVGVLGADHRPRSCGPWHRWDMLLSEIARGSRHTPENEQTPYAMFTAPLYVAWELTHKCNAQCLHCYSGSGPDACDQHDLTTEEALHVIDQLSEAGVLVLAFSGGEPLLRRDCLSLVQHAVGNGLSVNIGTNGWIVTDRMVAELRDIGVHSVTVSIDDVEPSSHDQIRGLEGLHARAVDAVRRLVSAGIRVVVGFTPMTSNWRSGPAVVRLAHKLGAAAVNLSEYVPAGRGTSSLAIRPEELHEVLKEWIALREQYRGRMEVQWHDCRVGLLLSGTEARNYVGCGAGRLVARILPDGSVTPCVFLPTSIGSLRTTRFVDLWRSSPLIKDFTARTRHVGNCGECEHLHTCGGCRAVAHSSSGNALAGDPHCWIKPMVIARDAAGNGDLR